MTFDLSDYSRARILLFRGRGVICALIRWQTRSRYAHAAIMLPNGIIIEAWQGAGVRLATITDWTNVEAFDIPTATPDQWRRAIRFARAQIGKKYDYRAIARFVSRRKSPLNNKQWFCSELVYESLRAAGVPLLRAICAAEVSPGLLALSPLLTPNPPDYAKIDRDPAR